MIACASSSVLVRFTTSIPRWNSDLHATTERVSTVVAETRRRLRLILRGQDDRLCVVVGPCSIHDVDSAMEYRSERHHRAGVHGGGRDTPSFASDPSRPG